jgi:hypothetical protein
MNSAPWLEIQRIKTATIPEHAAIEVIRDIDSAIERRSIVEIRAFAREAELSGMDQEAARAREIADLIEAKAGASGREELLWIKSAIEPPEPTQSELARAFDQEQLAAASSRSAPFSVNDHERLEAERAAEANRQLAARARRHEAQRAAQAARDAEPKGPARR